MVDQLLKEKSVWENLMEVKKPLVLYGMGDGADRVLKELSLLHVKISAVMASDSFVRGQSFHGFTVKTLSQIEQEFPDFIILLAFGSGRTEVIDDIRRLAGKHKILVPSVPVAGECIFNRSYLLKNGTEIDQAYSLMADEQSKKVFECMCRFEFTGELHCLFEMESSKDEAFKILALTSKENYLDLGAYRGDTIDEFLKYTCGQYNSITALEPDIKTYRKLCEAKGDLPNTNLINKGIWSHNTHVCMKSNKGKGSVIDSKGDNVAAVTNIDSLAKETAFTYIKIDVEGVEFIAISGGSMLLKEKKPKLNVACYHRCADIYRLPAMIKKINPDYKIYMRHHPYIPCWDTNLYCV
ncbi:MAG: FkbM family methyltransferase [Ruminococcus sp.]|nr:FkbM family methyltransferase [Ruminococcus sp.]